jgi:hypothetical protein
MLTALDIARRVTDYDSPTSPASRLRARRAAPLMDEIRRVHRHKGSVRIVDIGGRRNYWNIVPDGFLENHNVRVTLLNMEDIGDFGDPAIFAFTRGDACATPFEDVAFDICHSNSVLEHIGGFRRMRAFASEVRRIAAGYFVQTPNFWFPIEPHVMLPFFHWLPLPTRVWLCCHFSFGYYRRADRIEEIVDFVESINLVNKRMMRALFPEATLLVERFLLLPKSLIAFHRAALGELPTG